MTGRDDDDVPAREVRFVAEVLPDSCNAQVGSQYEPRSLRACAYPPKRVGQRGRLLCTWHANQEARYLAWLDRAAVWEATAGLVCERLEAHLSSVGFQVKYDPYWSGFGREPGHFTIELDLDEAHQLADWLDVADPNPEPWDEDKS